VRKIQLALVGSWWDGVSCPGMRLEDTTFDIDGMEVKFTVKDDSEVTVWAYRDTTVTEDIMTYNDEHPVGQITQRPAWVEIGSFNPKDYM